MKSGEKRVVVRTPEVVALLAVLAIATVSSPVNRSYHQNGLLYLYIGELNKATSSPEFRGLTESHREVWRLWRRPISNENRRLIQVAKWF